MSDAIDTIEVIPVAALLNAIFPEWRSAWDYKEERRRIQEWVKTHNAYYYACGREDFSIAEARNLALEAGKTIVVTEDLS